MRRVAAFACAVLLICFGVLPSHAERRVALVIGNGDYQHADKLANPVTDARRLRDTLGKLGFEVVYGEDVGKQALERTIGRFANVAQDADVALVFFAGHGATFGDIPYVVPIDAQFLSLGEVPYELVPVETLIGELRQAKGLRIAILDACRDNTAERELKRVTARGGEIIRGLARVKNPEGLILAYATQYLSTAADGDPNGDSPFTTALLNNIATPGLDVKDLFFKVGKEVKDSTKGGQRPEISVSFYDSYTLVPAGPATAATPSIASPSQDPAAQVRAAASDTYRNLNLFGDVFEKIRSDYVEKPDEQKLVEAAINGMLGSLDPHSSHMDAKPALLAGPGTAATPSIASPSQDPAAQGGAAATYRNLNHFGDVFEKIRSDYGVEKPDGQKLVEAAINGMLGSLDPHSSYMDAKSFRDMQVQTRGEFGGLGINMTQKDGLIKVVTPIDDTPASRAGILSGDIISAIDGENVQGLSLKQAVDKMRGAPDTSVTLKILRGSNKDPQDIKLTRAVIQIKSVRERQEGDDIGYIRITQFNEQTFGGVRAAIQKFRNDIPAAKFKGYILDLRNNPGGLLDQSIAVVNCFLDRGEIVLTRGRNADETMRYNARPGDLSKGKPVVVLINGGSASASEIVAGALQDHKRATILGTRSFGDGLVQTIIPLGQNNGAVRLTTARYYTPAGRSIQAKGIDPDVTVLQDVPDDLKGKDDTKGEASLRGHLKNGEDEKGGSQAFVPPDAKNDKQLIAAEDILRGVNKAISTLPRN